MNSFETMRHGPKGADGHITLEGREAAKEKAREIYEQIQNAAPGTVFWITPSRLDRLKEPPQGRAAETRNEIEVELQTLCNDDTDVVCVSVHDTEQVAITKDEREKKILITDIEPTSRIGFHKDTPYIPAWKKYSALFKGDEYSILLAWASRPEELTAAREEIHGRHTGVNTDTVQPQDFVQTPEEEAVKYLRLMRRMGEVAQEHFPDHPYKNIQVGHTVVDFAVLALMGRDISATSVRDLLGGRPRDFLESSIVENRDGTWIVRYRQEEVTNEVDLDKLIEELHLAGEERKRQWGRR